MVQYSNRAKICLQSEKDGSILKQSQNLSPVRKRWYNTQTVPKPVTSQAEPTPDNSQKKMVQYSNRAKTCHQSEKDGTTFKQGQNLSTDRKKMVQYLNRGKTCHQSAKYGTIVKQGQNLSPFRKRWYNTQTVPKPVTIQKKMVQYSNSANTCQQSEKKMVQYSNSAKTCQQSEKDGTILKQSENLSTVRKRWYNTQIEQPTNSQKKIVQYLNSAKTCHQSEKDGTILKQSNLPTIRKKLYNT